MIRTLENDELALAVMGRIGLKPARSEMARVLFLISNALEVINPDDAETTDLARQMADGFQAWATVVKDEA